MWNYSTPNKKCQPVLYWLHVRHETRQWIVLSVVLDTVAEHLTDNLLKFLDHLNTQCDGWKFIQNRWRLFKGRGEQHTCFTVYYIFLSDNKLAGLTCENVFTEQHRANRPLTSLYFCSAWRRLLIQAPFVPDCRWLYTWFFSLNVSELCPASPAVLPFYSSLPTGLDLLQTWYPSPRSRTWRSH